MIKIEIENISDRKNEFFLIVKDLLLKRISNLERALENLSGGTINIKGFRRSSLRPIVLNVVKQVDPKINLDLAKKNYESNLANYVNGKNNLASINIKEIFKFLNKLQSNPDVELRKLICCPANKLFKEFTKIKNDYSFTQNEIQILKSAFNYDDHNEISSKIRKFFRDHNFVKYCPYCNYTEVFHRNTSTEKKIVKGHELDHFFDKATYPLLCYSFFNLVPSDSICNKTNKHDTAFTDEFHLNPYSSGFGNAIKFFPVLNNSKANVSAIDIKVNENFGTPRYKQLLGLNPSIDEDEEKGNVNVFKLKSKYKDKIKEAQHVLSNIRKTNDGFSSIDKFLKRMFLSKSKLDANYIKWYENEFLTSFDQVRFNDNALSKFKRDIHDFYYDQISKSPLNGHIKELISKKT